ncbi:M28 family peptidase [Sphingomonas sp. HF-S4]|uniref:M28 family peptidase n=1 Tax=Sphingomonas agrestis TaxID=3080540 RepID=A0ABU3YCJ1_9SPHN|nr:M28 family peptidase [Sphingomonas sp. HF-S4]MDV3459114.1 M28 family peptidase [Sphingomonas sp. HF-S4]
MTVSKRAGWWGVVLSLMLLALWAIRPIGVSPPRHLDTEFNTERAVGRLAAILGDQRPHPTDSDANDALEARLLAQIRAAGFTPEIRQGFHCNDIRAGAAICARPRNIVFWITPPGDDAVMLTAHHDSVPAGPGAADDGIGVAVALEVAHLLKARPLGRPVLVLLTDAEEAGLVGAAMFAARDPLARRIGAVVNLEARGTTGAANMFQTSRPNGNDIAALRVGGVVPAANSLASDLYSILPNDTDLTMLLPLKVDAANFAIIGAGTRYHTPLDNLANLDRRSVRQMGAEALAAVTGFASLAGGSKAAEGQSIFVNIGPWFFFVLPSGVALALLVVGLGSAILVYARTGGGGAVKAALAPPLALLLGTGLAVLLGMLVAAIRPEAAFGTGWPIALRLMYGAAALGGAGLVLDWLRVPSATRLAASAWIWLTALVLAAFAFLPGLAVIASGPALFVLAAAIASLVVPRVVPWLFGAAALAFALVMLPIAGGFEDGLFVEQAAPIAALLIFLLLFAMPGASGLRAPLACGAVLAAALAAALLVPAYTNDAPRHLNVVHQDDMQGASFRIYDNGPLPPAMQSAARFAPTPDGERDWHALAPRLGDDGRIDVISDTIAGDLRTIVLRAVAPSADRQEFYVAKGEGLRGLTVNGARPQVKGALAYFGCTGRSCRTLDITLSWAAKAPLPAIGWHRTRYGAGEAARALVAARPATAIPVHVGDRQVLVRPVKLER